MKKYFHTLMLITMALSITACGQSKAEIEAIVAPESVVTQNTPTLGFLLQEEEFSVNRISLKFYEASAENYFYQLTFTHQNADAPQSHDIRFRFDTDSFNTVIAVLKDPVDDERSFRNAQAGMSIRTKYSSKFQGIPGIGLYFKQYKSMLVITNSYYSLAENQVHIHVQDALTLATLLVRMKDELDAK